MTRLLVLIFVFVLTALLSALLMLPLGFVLDRSGLAARNFAWASAQGTIWNGRIVGLTHNEQPYGDIQTSLRLGDIVLGRLVYDVRIQGALVRGNGVVRPGLNSIEATQVRLEVDLSAIRTLEPRLREAGGYLRLRSDRLILGRKGCVDVTGMVETDMISRIAAGYGQSWPEATGDLTCDAGTLVLPLSTGGPSGEVFSAQGRFGNGDATLEARVRGADAPLGYALGTFGFLLQDGSYVYRRNFGQPKETP